MRERNGGGDVDDGDGGDGGDDDVDGKKIESINVLLIEEENSNRG